MANALRRKVDVHPADTIRSLARQYGVVAERTAVDDLADVISNLAGDQVVHDEIEDLVVTLRRKGVITNAEATKLYGDYLASL